MSRITIAILVALLIATIEVAAVGNMAASQTEPPSVNAPDGCSDWSLTASGWTYSCVAYGDTWVLQEAYRWDSDLQTPVLYWYSFFDWVDLWGWSCYVPGACDA
jgi:hypothetical protein